MAASLLRFILNPQHGAYPRTTPRPGIARASSYLHAPDVGFAVVYFTEAIELLANLPRQVIGSFEDFRVGHHSSGLWLAWRRTTWTRRRSSSRSTSSAIAWLISRTRRSTSRSISQRNSS